MKLKCLICGRSYKHLGSHIWHGHKVTAREYKEEFGLPYKMALISPEIKAKKQDAFELDRERYLKNLTKAGTKYQFKKGHTGQRRISEHERRVQLERIESYNTRRKAEQCPVCKMMFDHLDSHLANKHRLLRIKDEPSPKPRKELEGQTNIYEFIKKNKKK